MRDRGAIDVVQAYAEAWLAGDLATVLGLYHPDLTLVWPGSHALAGEHRGLDASLTALAALQELTDRQPLVVHDIRDIHEESGVVVLDVTERWSDLAGAAVEVRRSLHYAVVDDRLHTCRVVEFDETLVHRLLDDHH